MITDAVAGWEWLVAPHVVYSLAVVCMRDKLVNELQDWFHLFLTHLGGIFFFSRWAAYEEADMAGDVIDGDKGGAVASVAALLR